MSTGKIRTQEALDYTLYMITGSYFRQAVVSHSQIQEEKLFLYYKEQRADDQYCMEDLCISCMEKFLMKELPEKIWEEKVMVKLVRFPDEDFTRVRFINQHFKMELMASMRGRSAAYITCFFQEAGDKYVRVIEKYWKAPQRRESVA